MTAKLKEQYDSCLPEEQLTLKILPGDQLSEARAKQKLSVAQVSAALRISERYVVAMEEHNMDVLPEQVYTLGFVRAYAIFLGLNAENLVEEFKKLTAASDNNTFDFPVPEKTSSVPKILIIVGSAIAIALIYAVWFGNNGENKPDVVTTSEEPKTEEPKVAEEIKTPVIDEIITPEKPKTEEASVKAAPVKDVNLEDFYVEPGQVLTVHATQTSWVEIKDSDGKVLLSATLLEGDSKPIVVAKNIEISTGNAGGISLSAGNMQTKVLGTSGQVLHSLEVPFKVPS